MSMIKWIRTSRLSVENLYLSAGNTRRPGCHGCRRPRVQASSTPQPREREFLATDWPETTLSNTSYQYPKFETPTPKSQTISNKRLRSARAGTLHSPIAEECRSGITCDSFAAWTAPDLAYRPARNNSEPPKAKLYAKLFAEVMLIQTSSPWEALSCPPEVAMHPFESVSQTIRSLAQTWRGS